MSSRNVSGVVPPALFEAAQQAVAYEGTTMSGLVSAALTLYLGLPGSARRSARYVLAEGSAEARDALVEGCARAIARAGDFQLAGLLAARGEAAGLRDPCLTDAALEAEAVAAVRETRRRVAAPARGPKKAARR